MELSQADVKQWLADHPERNGRFWLAEQLNTEKRTVDNWLSSPRGIPAHAQREIERMMAADRESERAEQPAPPMSLVAEVDLERFDTYNRAALSEGMIIRDWMIKVLDQAARRDMDAGMNIDPLSIAKFPKAAEDQAEYRSKSYWIDLHGGVAAGAQITSQVVPEPIPVDKQYPSDHYALRVFGQSCEPKIPDGSTIVVKAMVNGGYPRIGTIVVYSDATGSALKEFGYRKANRGEEDMADRMGNIPVLRSVNPAFPDVQTLDGGKIDAVFVEVL
jgi:SOS-response transcriptional repressor LexA